MVRRFNVKPQYNETFLKVEIPVNMNFVEDYTNEEPVYTADEAKSLFQKNNQSYSFCHLYIWSAGVSALFKKSCLSKDQGQPLMVSSVVVRHG